LPNWANSKQHLVHLVYKISNSIHLILPSPASPSPL
jgi:hypothetical protein